MSKIAALRDAYQRVAAENSAWGKLLAGAAQAVKKARQEYRRAMEEYNESLPVTLLRTPEDFQAYLDKIQGQEIVRPCFLHHQGKPTVYPCLAVSIRGPQEYDDVTYFHRFVTLDDAAKLGPRAPRYWHRPGEGGPLCKGAGYGVGVTDTLPEGTSWCPACEVVDQGLV